MHWITAPFGSTRTLIHTVAPRGQASRSCGGKSRPRNGGTASRARITAIPLPPPPVPLPAPPDPVPVPVPPAPGSGARTFTRALNGSRALVGSFSRSNRQRDGQLDAGLRSDNRSRLALDILRRGCAFGFLRLLLFLPPAWAHPAQAEAAELRSCRTRGSRFAGRLRSILPRQMQEGEKQCRVDRCDRHDRTALVAVIEVRNDTLPPVNAAYCCTVAAVSRPRKRRTEGTRPAPSPVVRSQSAAAIGPAASAVTGLAALARNFPLLRWVHRCKTTLTFGFGHRIPPDWLRFVASGPTHC